MNLRVLARARVALVLPLLGLIAGCGGTGTVSGTVSSKSAGKNLVTGTVMMMTADGTAHYSPINTDGTYQITRVRSGPVRVTVSSPDPNANATSGRGGEEAGGMPGKPTRGGAAAATATPTEGWFAIPEKYGDVNQSGLTFEVKKGTNTFDIELPE